MRTRIIKQPKKVNVAVFVETVKLKAEQRKAWFNEQVLPIVRKYQAKGDTWETAKKKAIAEYKLFN